MCVNLSMPEVVSTPPQHFPYELQVFGILRTEFEKGMLRTVWQVRGKRDHCLYLLPYRRWRVICNSNLAQGQSAGRVPDKPGKPLCTLPTKAQGAPNVHLQAGLLSNLLRAADRYAYTGCGSTACSVETVYGGKGELYTPDARPALLATPRRLTGDALPRLTGDALACLTGDALSLH
jgi:hypothetical protein